MTDHELLQEALCHHRSGRLTEAEHIYRQVLATEPNHADCLHLLGMTAFQTGRPEQAVEHIRRAIGLHPSAATYHANLGNVLQSQQNDAEAEVCYRASLAIRSNQAEVWMNLGHVLKKRAQVDSALRCYEQALSIHPQLAEAEAAKATALLLKGEFCQGWKGFEARWQTNDWRCRERRAAYPRWGGDSLASGRLLIWGEQGVGDEIMFAGLIPDVLAGGTPCALACEARLMPLFTRSFPEAVIISGDDPRELAELNVEVQMPSGSLPGIFRKTAGDFAQVTSPYLIADRAVREKFCHKYKDGRPLVGVAWHTRNQVSGHARSIALASLAPLFANQDVRWISLQYGDQEVLRSEVEASAIPIYVDDEVDQLQDLDCFAAQVAAMDLVVTIDNSTAHLSAALGVPTWVLVPHAPDWRWLLERADSPWYPTVRLFRALEPGTWMQVLERVESELSAAFSRG